MASIGISTTIATAHRLAHFGASLGDGSTHADQIATTFTIPELTVLAFRALLTDDAAAPLTALPEIIDRDADGISLALIGVRYAVAAADRVVVVRAAGRSRRADTGHVTAALTDG